MKVISDFGKSFFQWIDEDEYLTGMNSKENKGKGITDSDGGQKKNVRKSRERTIVKKMFF